MFALSLARHGRIEEYTHRPKKTTWFIKADKIKWLGVHFLKELIISFVFFNVKERQARGRLHWIRQRTDVFLHPAISSSVPTLPWPSLLVVVWLLGTVRVWWRANRDPGEALVFLLEVSCLWVVDSFSLPPQRFQSAGMWWHACLWSSLTLRTTQIFVMHLE